jgi:hypothetical protein
MQSEKLYCVKCRKKQTCGKLVKELDSRGKPRLHGVCKKCGCHCYMYVAKSKSKSHSKKIVKKSVSKRRL